MLALGTPLPEFSLPDVTTGHVVSSHDFFNSNALVVIFLCAHCPYVLHVKEELARLALDYADKAVAILGITSNDVENYPQDAPEPTARFLQSAGIPFPVLYDESQSVAKAFTAACTPDFFLFDADRKLAYRGQLDDSRPGRGTPDGTDLRAAIDAVLASRAPAAEQKPSIGCNIKWKSGNAPAYF